MSPLATKYLGIIFVIYGAFKLALGVAALSLSETQRVWVRDTFSWLKPFITMDMTVAGKLFELVIVLFALYTLFHGVRMLRKMPEQTRIRNMVYGVLGAVMIGFYGMIVFYGEYVKRVGVITWKEDETVTYKLMGIGGGLVFIITLLWILIWNMKYRKGERAEYVAISVALVLMVLAFLRIIWTTYDAIKSRTQEVVTMLMIPLAS